MSKPIENVIIMNSFVQPTDAFTLFQREDVYVTTETDLPRLLVEIGVFKSTSEARRAGRIGEVPSGWTDQFKASRKRRLWIWNPTT